MQTSERPRRLLRLRGVLDRTGKSRSSVYADKSFPKPINIGDRAKAWIEDEVDDWMERRIAERDAAA
ncbi:hypothetical protein ASD76_09640 [Altererythrobacter sp. Root672]|nr:hypothetical protein ASD76_09640 [Altererythrobacter sp. Root672]